MTRFIPLLILGIAFFSSPAIAQEFAYGFKAGLNFNSFRSDSETDDAGNEVEEFTGNTGFHVAATFTYKITDLVGVRGEFMFSQKGGRYKFNGPSYYIFTTDNDLRVLTTGDRRMNLNITNSYLDFPVMAYFKPTPSIEISGGFNIGVLVGSTAFGEFVYSGTTENGNPVAEFAYDLEYNYYRDDPGEASFGNIPRLLIVDGHNVTLPNNAGAYFEFSDDRGNLHKVIDFGVVAGLNFYLNKGLFLGFRANIGLSDFTKTEADVSKAKLDGNSNFIPFDLKDRQLSLQASIGFSF